jgi:hypothetical protein
MCRGSNVESCASGRRIALIAAGWFVLCALLGCHKSHPTPVYPTRGKVFYQGKPAMGAFVVFHALAGEENPAAPRATVGPDGEFALSTFAKEDGAPAGDYAVSVEWRKLIKRPDGETEAGANLLPPRYAKPETSGLRATVSPTSQNELPAFDLTR